MRWIPGILSNGLEVSYYARILIGGKLLKLARMLAVILLNDSYI